MRASRVDAVLLAAVAATAGCGVPLASSFDDARMKHYLPGPDRALIYVYRDDAVAFRFHMPVDLDGLPYGATVARTYMVFEVPPGPHLLVSHAENLSTLLLRTEPGRRYFVWQAVRVGLTKPRSELQEMPDVYGAIRLGMCQLIAMPLPR